MAKLVYSLSGIFLGEFPLEKERTTIGRRTYNDIHIDNLAISGEHAAIIRSGDHFLVEDLESTNGTIVNGKAVKKRRLHDGDIVSLGKCQLKFLEEAVLEPENGHDQASLDMAASGEARAKLEFPSWKKQPTAPVGTFAATGHFPDSSVDQPPVSATAAAPGAARIRVLNGPAVGVEFNLTKAVSSLGKPGGEVAAIARRPEGYVVIHAEGETYPMINGETTSERSRSLHDHDVLEIAGVRMEFTVGNP